MNIILWDLPRDEYNYANQLQYQINNLGCVIYNTCPGEKVRVITREARYYAKTRAFASFHAIISRAHAARAVT